MEPKKIELRRHIDLWLTKWRANSNRKPALIFGIRQSGKTHSIKRFAEDKQNYECAIYLNFWDKPELISAFDNDLSIDNLIKEISVKMPLPNLVEGKTVFIFDEVQECPRALLSLKTNENDPRYDFIASGSFLGIRGYIVGDATPRPVGSTDEFVMRTLDFEEFLWAKGYSDAQVNLIRDSFENRKPMSASMHAKFTSLFREYLCVGGFPETVRNYVATNNIYTSVQTTRRITADLQNDFGRRKGKDGKPLFQPNEVARIRSAFSLIPAFLGKENKRYVVSKITGEGSKDSRKDALHYLCDAGVIVKSCNLDVPATPLASNANQSQFKVFPTDIGMLVGMLENGVTDALLSGNLGFGKGMLYEALVADAIYKRGAEFYYFAKDTGLELDFVVNLKGETTILEVKSANGNAKSAKTVMKHPEHYGKTQLIYIKDANIGYADGVLTIPHYMAWLLFPWSDTLPIR